MTVKYCIKTHDVGLAGTVTRYSDSTMDEVLAVAEQFFITAKVVGVGGTSPTLTVMIEHSLDGVNWVAPSLPIFLTALTAGIVNDLRGSEVGSSLVFGRYVRIAAFLGGTGSLTANVEIWVCGRSAV